MANRSKGFCPTLSRLQTYQKQKADYAEMAAREAINKLSHFMLQCAFVCVRVPAVCIYVTICVAVSNLKLPH